MITSTYNELTSPHSLRGGCETYPAWGALHVQSGRPLHQRLVSLPNSDVSGYPLNLRALRTGIWVPVLLAGSGEAPLLSRIRPGYKPPPSPLDIPYRVWGSSRWGREPDLGLRRRCKREPTAHVREGPHTDQAGRRVWQVGKPLPRWWDWVAVPPSVALTPPCTTASGP